MPSNEYQELEINTFSCKLTLDNPKANNYEKKSDFYPLPDCGNPCHCLLSEYSFTKDPKRSICREIPDRSCK